MTATTATTTPTMKHTSKNDSILKIALNLTGACIISGLIIAGTYFLTHDIAVQGAAKLKTDALQGLFKAGETDKFESIKVKVEGKEEEWSVASKDGKIIAYVVSSENTPQYKGYGGPIKMLVAVTPDAKVKNFSIIESKETPGLGDKASKEPFFGQFMGKDTKNLEVTKVPSEKDKILAISGATITSRAVTSGVKKAVDDVANYLKEGGK